MAKRKVKKAAQKSSRLHDKNSDLDAKEPTAEKAEETFRDQEVERQIAAMKAITEMEVENLLSDLRLLRSCFNEQQLQTPVLQFFRENLPNVSITGNGKDVAFDLQLKADGNPSMNDVDTRDLHASLLHHMTMAYPGCSSTLAPFNGLQLSSKAVKTSLVDTDALQIENYAVEGPSTSEIPGFPDVLQTPGANNQRLSIGMTPKSQRLPKNGEMLLSVHGSPLGVYKEDNMEAISEAEEG